MQDFREKIASKMNPNKFAKYYCYQYFMFLCLPSNHIKYLVFFAYSGLISYCCSSKLLPT